MLFHVTANADWSTLPLSGLFVQMLERLAVSTRPAVPQTRAIWPGRSGCRNWCWMPLARRCDADEVPGVEGEALAKAVAGRADAALPPGLYAGAERRVALNAVGAETPLIPRSGPTGTAIEGLDGAGGTER